MLITRIQIDGGSSVNLMSAKTMEKLGLTQLRPTTLILKMVDESQVKPTRFLLMVHTIIIGMEYKIDCIMFKLLTLTFSYPILLGKSWLYQVKAKNDWGKETLILGQHESKNILQMYLVQYHGETQDKESNFTSNANDTIEDIELKNVPSSIIHCPTYYSSLSTLFNGLAQTN